MDAVPNLLVGVQRFRAANPGFADPGAARGSCYHASLRFLGFLREGGFLWTTLEPFTYHSPIGEADVVYGSFRGGAHAFVHVGRVGIDWTYRQYDPGSSFPRIFRIEEEEIWRINATRKYCYAI